MGLGDFAVSSFSFYYFRSVLFDIFLEHILSRYQVFLLKLQKMMVLSLNSQVFVSPASTYFIQVLDLLSG